MMRLPTKRHPISGRDLDGNPVTLKLIISKQLYACPGCRGRVEIGEEHVLVQRTGVDSYHQHWHTRCATAIAREIELAEAKKRSSR
jgi:hypothetical protein